MLIRYQYFHYFPNKPTDRLNLFAAFFSTNITHKKIKMRDKRGGGEYFDFLMNELEAVNYFIKSYKIYHGNKER